MVITSKASILIVDDDESTRRTLVMILERNGYAVETAASGQAALAKAQQHPFDAALLDLRLPDVAGVDLLGPLKAIRADMALFMVTGNASMATAIQALNDGAAGYLTKPLEMSEALAKIRDALEKRRLIQENRRLYEEAQQEIASRVRVEEELRQLNAELEQRVLERTSQLAQRETALRESYEKLKVLDEMKTQFVSGVSHELRTPLHNIRMYLQLLATGAPEKRERYLATVEREADLLQSLIEDLLLLSRLDLGQAPFRPIDLDAGQLAAAFVEDRGALVREQGHDLRLKIEEGGLRLWADARWLSQVLSNLVTNAVNYTPRGGVINVDVRRAEDDGRAGVVLAVSDTGPGIAPEEQRQIFERFYRGEAARASRAPGTGLGLALAQEFVKRHHGKITLDSQPGKGSTFSVWLPVAPPFCSEGQPA